MSNPEKHLNKIRRWFSSPVNIYVYEGTKMSHCYVCWNRVGWTEKETVEVPGIIPDPWNREGFPFFSQLILYTDFDKKRRTETFESFHRHQKASRCFLWKLKT